MAGGLQKFPTKKEARCFIEALLKRVLYGNLIDAFLGDLHLGVMKGGEPFLPIGGEKEEPPLTGEVAYYDGAGVVCRCWNWRDGQRTAVTAENRELVIAAPHL